MDDLDLHYLSMSDILVSIRLWVNVPICCWLNYEDNVDQWDATTCSLSWLLGTIDTVSSVYDLQHDVAQDEIPTVDQYLVIVSIDCRLSNLNYMLRINEISNVLSWNANKSEWIFWSCVIKIARDLWALNAVILDVHAQRYCVEFSTLRAL